MRACREPWRVLSDGSLGAWRDKLPCSYHVGGFLTQLARDRRLSVRYYASPLTISLENAILYVPRSPTEFVLDFLWVARGVKRRVVLTGSIDSSSAGPGVILDSP